MESPETRPEPERRQSKWRIGLSFVAFLGTLVLVITTIGFFLHAGVVHGFLVLGGMFLGGLVVAVSTIILFVYAVRGQFGSRKSGPLAALGVSLAVLIAAVFSVPVGVYFQGRHLASAQKWCEARASAIEEYKSVHDRYPATFEEVCSGDSIPWTVRTFDPMFHSGADWYSFDLSTGWLAGYSYNSGSRVWTYYD